VAENAVRAIGYLFEHCIVSGQTMPAGLIVPFAKTMNHSNNDVKLLVATMATHLPKAQGRDSPIFKNYS
jgi:hypothetical protein